MNVTVLGKYGPYPKAGGAASGYLLSAGGNRILLDCGSGVFSRLISLCPPEELSAVHLTHLHADHSSDLGVMNYYLQRLGRELDVFLPVDAVRFSAIEGMKGFRFHPVREGVPDTPSEGRKSRFTACGIPCPRSAYAFRRRAACLHTPAIPMILKGFPSFGRARIPFWRTRLF